MSKSPEKAPAAPPKSAVKGTYGTMYYVKDMKKSVEWFSDRLGLKPGFESADWTEFHVGGQALCLHLLGKNAKDSWANGAIILHVDGIKQAVDALKAKGATIKTPVHEVHPGAWAANLADPDGNVVGLYEGPKAG